MASVNKVILLGNLGRDPEVRYAPDGAMLARISLATSRSWIDQATKEKRSETEWHNLMLYGRQAEIAEQYLKKGHSAYFEGRLRTRKWTDKNNIERYFTEIVVDTLQMLGSRTDDFESTTTPPTQATASMPSPAANTHTQAATHQQTQHTVGSNQRIPQNTAQPNQHQPQQTVQQNYQAATAGQSFDGNDIPF